MDFPHRQSCMRIFFVQELEVEVKVGYHLHELVYGYRISCAFFEPLSSHLPLISI